VLEPGPADRLPLGEDLEEHHVDDSAGGDCLKR
jgi:hypothetical protein